jgi:endonuclease/exonuclease/phosphatase family metal-dependent hydrolase
MSLRFLAPAALSLLTLTACGSDSSPAPAPSQLLAVDSFNVYLAGAFSPNELERRQPILDAVASLDSDIVCLQEVWRDSDKDALVQAAKGRFPHAVVFKTTLETPLDAPQDQTGKVPPPSTEAPCAGPDQSSKLDAVLQCVQENCSTVPGSAEGMTVSTDCVVQKCTAPAAGLLFGETQDLKCYGCAATLLPTDTLQQIRQTCTTNKNAGLAFDGQNGLVLLSKLPLQNPEQLVIPGTWNRRTITRATVELPIGVSVDVYCNHLPPVFTQPAFPYTGDYGKGKTNSEGWLAELLLDAQKLIDWVEANSGSRKAIILGDFNASPELKDQGIEAEAAEAYTLLTGKFTPALPAGFKPACTYCGKGENVLASSGTSGPNTWIDHVFLKNIAAADVVSSTRTFTEPVVAVPPDSLATKLPLSDHFGVHTVITIRP